MKHKKRKETKKIDRRLNKVKIDDMAKRTLTIPKTNSLNLDFLVKNDLDLYELLEHLEVSLLIEAIKKNNGNYSAAARMLRINRTTFMMKIYKIRHFDVPFPKDAEEKQEASGI